MNFKLVKTEIDSNVVETVNARDIWEKLESKQQFADWAKKRIVESGFEEK